MRILNKNKFYKACKANVATEFAILLPVLIIAMIGFYDISRYVAWERSVSNMIFDISNIISRQDVIEGLDEETGIRKTGQVRLQKIVDSLQSSRETVNQGSSEQNIFISNFLYPTNVTSSVADPGIRQMWLFKSDKNTSNETSFIDISSKRVSASKSKLVVNDTELDFLKGEGVNIVYFTGEFNPIIMPKSRFFHVKKLYWSTNDIGSKNYICSNCAESSSSMGSEDNSLRKKCARPETETGFESTSGCEFD